MWRTPEGSGKLGSRRLSGVALAGSMLAACSPYVYSDDVQKFSKDMTAVDTSYQQTAGAIVVERHLANRIKWSRDRTQIMLGPGCGMGAAGPIACDLAPRGPPPAAAAPPSPPRDPPKDVCAATTPPESPPGAKTAAIARNPLARAALLKALDNYIAALAAITKAQDRADFDTAAAKVSAAVGDLASAAGPHGAAAAPLAKASSNLALWLVGQDLDYRRLKQLRLATGAACEPVHNLAEALAFALEEQRDAYLTALKEVLTLKVQAVNRVCGNRKTADQACGAAIDDAYAAAAAFEAVKTTDPRGTAAALRQAHDELVVAVRNDDGQLAALLASLQAFAQRANDLATAAAAAAKKT